MKNLIFIGLFAIILMSCTNWPKSKSDKNDSTQVNNELQKTSDVEENSTKVTSDYFITNNGIAGLKLGMPLEDVKSELSGLICEKVIMEIDEIEYYVLKKGKQQICQFDLDQENLVRNISAGDEYKTKEGIGTLSTVEEIKKKYTLLPYKLVDGAEGIPFVCLTVKELPNLQMWLNVEVPDDYYKDEQKILDNIPESSKVINIYIEKSTEIK